MIKYLILIFISFEALASRPRHLNRSPRGLLMGDAYTSIATDEYTLYYNPALLARHSGFSFMPFNPSIHLTNAIADADRFSDMPSDPVGIADQIMDYPMHLGMNVAPGFKMGNFGLSAIVYNEFNMVLMNQITPTLDIDYRADRGFIMGYAHPLSGSLSKEGGTQLAMGFAVKHITRESIYESFNLTSPGMLTVFEDASSPEAILDSLGKVRGQGWGFDVGFDYVTRANGTELGMSLAMLDMYTLLNTEKNDEKVSVQPQPMGVNLGAHWTQKFAGIFDYTFSADLRNLSQQMDFMQRVHMGVEVGFPVLRVLAGTSSGYYSYGIQFNLGLIKTYLGLYELEIGEEYKQRKVSRAVIYFSLFDFTFDA
jgi:hypothetical protein